MRRLSLGKLQKRGDKHMGVMERGPAIGQSNIPDSRGTNFYDSDPGFGSLLRVYLGQFAFEALEPKLVELGRRVANELDVLAATADKNPPTLRHRTRRGEDLQSIDKHPAYVELERVAYSELGLASMSHRGEAIAPLVKYALTFLFVQAEFGLCCPVSMTDSLTRTLRKFGAHELVARYLPGLTATDLDQLSQGAMFITEQAAGSDIGGVSTQAKKVGDEWRITGDKWF